MDERQAVTTMSLVRVGIGAALAAAPGLGRGWVGDVADRPGGRALLRAFGVRDAVLGMATLNAVHAGEPVRGLVLDGVLVDAGDLVATLAAFPHLPRWRRYAVVATSAAAVVLGVWLLSEVD